MNKIELVFQIVLGVGPHMQVTFKKKTHGLPTSHSPGSQVWAKYDNKPID